MNTVLVACIVLITVAFVVAVVFLVKTLIQIQRTASEAEALLKGANHELEVITRVTDSIASLTEKLGSPWVKAGAVVTGLASGWLRNRIGSKKSVNSKENI